MPSVGEEGESPGALICVHTNHSLTEKREAGEGFISGKNQRKVIQVGWGIGRQPSRCWRQRNSRAPEVKWVNARYWIPSTSGKAGAMGELPYLRGLMGVSDQGLKCQCSIHTCKLLVCYEGKRCHSNATKAKWHLCLPKLPQQLPRDKAHPPPRSHSGLRRPQTLRLFSQQSFLSHTFFCPQHLSNSPQSARVISRVTSSVNPGTQQGSSLIPPTSWGSLSLPYFCSEHTQPV